MAVKTAQRTEVAGRAYRHTWSAVKVGDTFNSFSIPGAADRSVQVFGTFGGATVTIQGSLQDVPTHWFALTDLPGNPISFTADGGEFVSEPVVHTRAVLTGGDGTTDITVMVLSRSTKR